MSAIRENFEVIVFVLLPVLLILIVYLARRLKFSMKEGYDTATLSLLGTLMLVFTLGAVFGNLPTVSNAIRPRLAKILPAHKFVRVPTPEVDFKITGDQLEILQPAEASDPNIVWVVTVDSENPADIIAKGKIVTVGHKQKIEDKQLVYFMDIKSKLVGSPVHVSKK